MEAEAIAVSPDSRLLTAIAPLHSPSSGHLPYYTRLFNLVVQSNRDLLAELVELQDEDSPSPAASHLNSHLLPIMTLAQTLYISPSAIDGQHAGEGIIGEELLHWLNSHDLAPTTEQGQEIASSSEPYLHPAYWDYILRCTLRGFHSTASTLLATLLGLPSQALQDVVTRLRSLVDAVPRSMNFKTEIQFKSARREFILQLNGVLSGLETVMDEAQEELKESYAADTGDEEQAEEDAEDTRLSLEAGLRVFLEVLAGNRERVVEAAEDWKEALAAWATLVDVGLKRDGMAAALDKIEELRGPDSFAVMDGLPESDKAMVTLIRGQISEACTLLPTIDPYLAQILIDFVTKLAILPSAAPPEQGVRRDPTPSEQANLVYANTILATYGFWRMSVDYLSYAGIRGRARMSEILLGLPLLEDSRRSRSLANWASAAGLPRESGEEQEEQAEDEDEFQLVESVLEACFTFGLTREAKAIGRKIALHLSSQEATPSKASSSSSLVPRFGPATIFGLRSPPRGDTTLLKTIKRRVLDGMLDQTKATSQSRDQWLVDHVTDLKRWIVRSARLEAARAEDADANAAEEPSGPFRKRSALISNGRGGAMSSGTSFLQEGDEILVTDEDEWNHHFGQSLPAPIIFLTNFSQFFQLRQLPKDGGGGATTAAATLLIGLLNAGLVDGDWTAICLYEIGRCLSGNSVDTMGAANVDDLAASIAPTASSSSSRALLSQELLYDALRILESLLTNAALSSEEEDFYLGNLGRWAGASDGAAMTSSSSSSTLSNSKPRGESQRHKHQQQQQQLQQERTLRISIAKREMQALRLKIAVALGISAVKYGEVDPGVDYASQQQQYDEGGDGRGENEYGAYMGEEAIRENGDAAAYAQTFERGGPPSFFEGAEDITMTA